MATFGPFKQAHTVSRRPRSWLSKTSGLGESRKHAIGDLMAHGSETILVDVTFMTFVSEPVGGAKSSRG